MSDVALPRKPYGPQLGPQEMSSLIAEAVNAIKRGDKSPLVISEWAEFLRDMYTTLVGVGAASVSHVGCRPFLVGGIPTLSLIRASKSRPPGTWSFFAISAAAKRCRLDPHRPTELR